LNAKRRAPQSGKTRPPRGAPPRRPGERQQIYGIHAAEAALANPARAIHRVYATPNAQQRLEESGKSIAHAIIPATPKDIDRIVGEGAVHQGVLVEAEPLPEMSVADLGEARLVLALDQITDPHNVGAILRSAAAFGVEGLIMTARHSPRLSGALAKAASGALEHVPVVLAPNLARALAELGEMGFARIGLDSGAGLSLEDYDPPERLALVLGAEDRGLRRLTGELCDEIRALGTFGAIASLNVSNAAAIALHMMAHKMRSRPER
jgi:23S rRNA (guanosine2251-2'-O)-methyltransferase